MPAPIVSQEVSSVRLNQIAEPLPALELLTHLASLAPPSSPLENNVLGLTLEYRSPSPLLLAPPANSPDPDNAPDSRPQESPSVQTFGVRSPSYHVQSPTPSPPPVPASPLFPPSRRCSAPPNTTLPLLPAAEEDRLDNQENRPPTASLPYIQNPYAPPPCTQVPHRYHPHQFFIVRHDGHETWRPASETQQLSLLEFLTVSQIVQNPPAFSSVLQFKGYSHHTSTIVPTDAYQAGLFSIPALTVCAYAGLSEPTLDIPLGYIHYSFRTSIKQLFTRLPLYTRLCFSGALVISEVHDFLDGRRILTYGYLRFDGPHIFIADQAHYFEDAVRAFPVLYRYSLSLRLPLDPFNFIQFFSDILPL